MIETDKQAAYIIAQSGSRLKALREDVEYICAYEDPAAQNSFLDSSIAAQIEMLKKVLRYIQMRHREL